MQSAIESSDPRNGDTAPADSRMLAAPDEFCPERLRYVSAMFRYARDVGRLSDEESLVLQRFLDSWARHSTTAQHAIVTHVEALARP